jgi:hypothetical protein
MALLLPQMLIAKKQFDSWNPYPSSTVATRQIAAGIAMFRYTTVIGGPHQGGFPTYTPFKDEPDKTLGFYTTHPAEGAALVLGHVWAGLNYDTFGVYVSWASLGPVTAALLFSATVSALGLFGLVAWPGKGDDTELRAFLTTGLLGSCAYTALAATETRFGLWGFLCVSMAVAHLLAEKEGRRRALLAAPVLLAYVLASIEINALLYFRAAT